MVLVNINSANIFMVAPRDRDATHNAPDTYLVGEEL
jgi:hypothetical protein